MMQNLALLIRYFPYQLQSKNILIPIDTVSQIIFQILKLNLEVEMK